MPHRTALCQVPAKAAEVPKPVSAAAQIGDVQDHERCRVGKLPLLSHRNGGKRVCELADANVPEFGEPLTIEITTSALMVYGCKPTREGITL